MSDKHVTINIQDVLPSPNSAVVEVGKNPLVYNQEQVNQKLSDIQDGISSIIITPTTPASELTTLPNAVYRIQGKGTYNLLVNEVVEGVTINGDKTVVAEGYDVKFVKSDNGWKVASSVKMPSYDGTELQNRITQVEQTNTQFRADVDNDIAEFRQNQEDFIENFSVEVDQKLDINSDNAISNKAIAEVLPTKTEKKLLYGIGVIQRQRLGLNGKITTNTNWVKEFASDFIELKKDNTISFKAHQISTSSVIAVYSANDEESFIKSFAGLSTSATTSTEEIIEYSYTAENDCFVRLGLNDSTATSANATGFYKRQFFISSTKGISISELTDEKVNNILISSLGSYNDYSVENHEIKYAGSLGSTGSFSIGNPPVLALGTTANRGWISDWIEVKKGDKIITHSMVRDSENAISFYKDKRVEDYVIGVKGIGGTTPTVKLKYELIVPEDGYVLSCCFFTNGNASLVPPIVQIHRPIVEDKVLQKILVRENNLTKNINRNVSSSRIRFEKPTQGAFSIIDDDGHADVYDLLYPYLRDKGIPFGSAIVGSWHDKVSRQTYNSWPRMTEAELLEMAQDKAIVEIFNHTYTHAHAIGTEEHIRFELETNHKWLTDRGIHPKGFVAPQGQYDLNTIKVTSEMYPCLYTVLDGVMTTENMRNFEIKRVDYGASNSNHKTFASIKPYIDQAIANNGWMILMTHVGGYNGGDTWWPVFEEICDYVESSAITPMLPSDAFAAYGNFSEVYQVNKMSSDYQVRNY